MQESSNNRCLLVVRDLRDLGKYPHDFKEAFVPMPTAENDKEESYFRRFMDYLSINSKSKNQKQHGSSSNGIQQKGFYNGSHGRIPASAAIDQNIVAESFAGVELFDMESFKNN